jgi:flavodoxin I
MKNIKIVYGSTTGSTQTVAEWIENTLVSKGASVSVHEVSSMDVSAVADADLILLGSSTWGEGDIQDDFLGFYEAMDKASFADKSVAVFGCGDSDMFPHVFCEAVTLIEEKATECGARVVTEGLKVDGIVSDHEQSVRTWAESLI